MEEEPILAAGLWEKHEEHGFCYTMVRTEADPETMLGKIHNRMQVILTPEDGDQWMAEEPASLAWSPGIEVKETIVTTDLFTTKTGQGCTPQKISET